MPHPEPLVVTAGSDKEKYTDGEVPQFTAAVTTEAGDPVYADLQWGMRILPDGEWVDYSREYPVHTGRDTGAANWSWPSDDYGSPEVAKWEMAIDARAYDDAGSLTGEGSAGLTFEVVPKA
jgi:hypothetical protein